MTIQEFQNQITELINAGKLSPDMDVVTFDGEEYVKIMKSHQLNTEIVLEDGATYPALVISYQKAIIDTDF